MLVIGLSIIAIIGLVACGVAYGYRTTIEHQRGEITHLRQVVRG